MKRTPLAAAVVMLGGCTAIPDLQRDRSLPLREILEHTACELQGAFRSLTADRYKRFKAERWLISVKLTPKVDTDLTAGVGASWKNAGTAGKLVTWTLGTPGVQLNAKGNRTGGITYSINSEKLIADTRLKCDRSSESYHALARHLGVGEWLRRTVSAMDGTLVAELDSPTYSSQITIKYSANGSYSFSFAAGSELASLGGTYTDEQQLSITMSEVKAAKSFSVVTLPEGEKFPAPKPAAVGRAESDAIRDAKARNELLQLEQAIRSLRIQE